MSGRTIIRVLAAVALVGLLAVVGVNLYNGGVSAGLGEAARLATASGDPVPAYGYPGPYVGHGWGYGWGGFGVFGIFFWFIGIFLVFGLIRAAFWGGRWAGPHDGSRGGHLEDWHRRAHETGSDHAAG